MTIRDKRKLKQLKRRLRILGVKQEEVARICGVTPAHFSFFINGIRQSKSLQAKLEHYIQSLESRLHKHNKREGQ